MLDADPKIIASYFYLRQLVCRYPTAVDRRDFKLLRSILTSDATFSIPHLKIDSGNPDEIVASIKQIEMFERTYHSVHNHTFEIDPDAGKASGEVYCTAVHVSKDGARMDMGIRYHDHYAVENDDWRFQRRVLLLDWQSTDKATLPPR